MKKDLVVEVVIGKPQYADSYPFFHVPHLRKRLLSECMFARDTGRLKIVTRNPFVLKILNILSVQNGGKVPKNPLSEYHIPGLESFKLVGEHVKDGLIHHDNPANLQWDLVIKDWSKMIKLLIENRVEDSDSDTKRTAIPSNGDSSIGTTDDVPSSKEQ